MIRVLVADDHPIVRNGVKQILTDEFCGATVGEACNTEEMLDQIMSRRWDILVLDLAMPGGGGLDALRKVKLAAPPLPVLVLSMHPEDQFAVRVIRAGAAGYLNKEGAPQELIQAIRKILAGGRYIRPSVAELLALHVEDERADRPVHTVLSDREYQILRLIGEGKTVGDIAANLALSIKTVSTYRTRVLQKLHLKNTSELIRYALHHHLAD